MSVKRRGIMKLVRIAMCCVVLGGVATLVSCKKETPADKIGGTTSALENEVVTLDKEAAAKKLEAENAEVPVVNIDKPKK